MKMWKMILPVTAVLLFAGPTNAQSDEDRSAKEAKKAEYSERLREAEERMEKAAREIAEISRERLPQIAEFRRKIEISGKPRIGITIDSDSEGDAVEGVAIIGVTPGTAADEAGLHSGDIITNVGDTSLSAENSMAANKKLLKVMDVIVEGDVLTVEYLRNGNIAAVELTPKVHEGHAFSWAPNGGNIHIERIPGVPEFVKEFKFENAFAFFGGPWASMELVEITEGLGKYFGTDSGLLVVSSPEGIDLEDGDVIQSIDGREPSDVRHALRILGSYEDGEKIEIGIMRDKKKRTIEVAVPADQRGSLFEAPLAVPVRAPLPAPPVRPVPPVADIST